MCFVASLLAVLAVTFQITFFTVANLRTLFSAAFRTAFSLGILAFLFAVFSVTIQTTFFRRVTGLFTVSSLAIQITFITTAFVNAIVTIGTVERTPELITAV